jgi:8-oxo-dGTP pyrophosphatase MutT (NUDIX family)
MLPEIYVHRRTDTKRIFPSLYDMFVGGVATAGESLKLTAAREVGEELGLTRPSLSDELFKCIVCTSYNRCVVTVYTYEFDSGLDRISWQEEEVQWGDFVSYDVVEKSRALSIDRLRQKNQWPGRNGDALEVRIRTLMKENEGRQEDKWDYVPDGLLVWMAWIDWLSR